MKVAWVVEVIRLKSGEKVDLGKNPKGGILFSDEGEPLGFRPYDGLPRDYDIQEVSEVCECGEWYPLEEYLDGDFSTLVEAI